MEEMLTVKEWAKKAGLELVNYDGFVSRYEQLTSTENRGFETHVANRMKNAGNLLCTRRAFQSCLLNCSMYMPTIDQYESMADVIPDFVEFNLNINISFSLGYLKDGKDLRKSIETLLKLMNLKRIVREKCLKINGIIDEVSIAELEEKDVRFDVLDKIKQYDGTVEGLEVKLIDEIIIDLEKVLTQKRIKLFQVPIEKIRTLSLLLYSTARKRNSEPLENEFMYIDILGVSQEPFVQPYNVLDENGERSGVFFDILTEQGRVKGAMPTTPEIDKKIRKNIEVSNNKTQVDESLEIIDSQVGQEERREFMKKFEDFVKYIADLFKGNIEGR